MEKFGMGFVDTPKLEEFTTDLITYVGVGVNVAFNSLKELEIIGNKTPFYHHKISFFLFNGLEKLLLHGYDGSMSIFSSSAVGNLVNLRVLEINNCYKILLSYCDVMLVKVIEDEEEKEDGKYWVSGGEIRTVILPKLEELRLYNLPNLLRFCDLKCDVELPSLTTVDISWCPNMESFSMGFVAAPNLKFVNVEFKKLGATKDLNGAMQQLYLARQEKENEEEEEEKDEIVEEDDQN